MLSPSVSRASSSLFSGGAATVTWAELDPVKPRASLQVAFTVMVPGAAPVVFKVAVLPVPEMVPPLAFQPPTFTWTLSGLLHSQVTVADWPAGTEAGLTEQLMVGGFFGGSFTVKVWVQVASLLFFARGSTM